MPTVMNLACEGYVHDNEDTVATYLKESGGERGLKSPVDYCK